MSFFAQFRCQAHVRVTMSTLLRVMGMVRNRGTLVHLRRNDPDSRAVEIELYIGMIGQQ